MSRISGATNIDFGNVTINIDELEELAGKTLVHQYDTAAGVSPAATVTILTYTVPAGKKVRVKGMFFEGSGDALFSLEIAGTEEWQGRNAWTDRNVRSGLEYEATAGQEIELLVENLNDQVHTFTGGFYGYQLNA